MRIFSKLIIVFIAFIIIPMAVVSYIFFYNFKITLQNEIFSKLNIVADKEKDRIEVFLSERKAAVAVLERRDIYKTALPELERFSQDRSNPAYIEAKKAIDQRLAIFQRAYKYVDIMLTNMEGRIIYVVNPEHEFELGTIIADKNYVFQKARTGIYIGDIRKTAYKKYPYTLFLAGLVYGPADKVMGLVHLELDVSLMYKFMHNSSALGESYEMLLAMKTLNNKIVFINPLKYEPGAVLTKTIAIGVKEALPAQKSVLGESGSGMSIDYRGKEVLAAWRPIPSLGWGLVTKVDAQEAFLPIERLRKLLLGIISIAIFSALLAAIAIAKSISDPIYQLRRGTEIIGSGDLDYKVGTDTKDEIGQLSRAFDAMTASLKKSTTSIESLNKEVADHKKAEEKIIQAYKKEIKSREIVTSMLADNNNIREELQKSLENLKESQDQLIQAEKMEAIGMMATGIAHEVKNPLGIILQGINYFEGELPPGEKEQLETLQTMKDGVKRADRIVRALLDFSRAAEIKTELQDISTVIKSVIGLVGHKLKTNSIEIVSELGKDLPKTLIDRGRIEQVFINLFNNAADAMPQGGKLYVRSSYVPELKAPGNKVGNREGDIFGLKEEALVVEVEDTGIGMDDIIMSKIFDPFFTTKSRAEGTGLGLSIAKNIIEMHNGLIKVESKKGQGTKFTVVLKLAGGG